MDSALPSLVRLLQLVSPALPIGSFSYSQGLEWAVEHGWISGQESLCKWLDDCLHRSVVGVDLPIMREMYSACSQHDRKRLDRCCDLLLACRESKELQEEESQRGRALGVLLRDLELVAQDDWLQTLYRSQLAGFVYAASNGGIELTPAAIGYTWAWLENQVIAGVKIIPLGQTSGQLLLVRLGYSLPRIVAEGLAREEAEIGSASPALALASSLHESQYARLYRS